MPLSARLPASGFIVNHLGVWGISPGERRYQEHLRIIDHFQSALKSREKKIRILEQENADQGQAQDVHQRQFKANTSKENNVKSKDSQASHRKKCGAPVGHAGWSRVKPDRIDQTIDVPAPTQCPIAARRIS
jgi:hypothetical protein